MKQMVKMQLPPDAPFEQQFFTLISRICRQLVLHAEQIKADDTLSPPQLWFLKRLYDAGAPQPISFFADGVFSNRSNASQMIDRLEAEGLVYRIRNPRDRRSVLVELTDAGVERMHHAEACHMELARELLDPLTEEERVAALSTFARVLTLFEEGEDDAGLCSC
ncbi:MAG: MarR family transcriptional regulator [Anaerolineae bacterium]|nr:MarR family transcriptional regulator [Anaerolineae bacterium]